ncbi:MAG: PAS domain S-box protein [Methanofollis sp.]|uniref:PAS domain S-box protein n=1 Tax=Methanofollis sp. TaxID=2052835 RepID=UPI00263A3996|nr:PAS domain S-box protein [Methanofollis sp.]MDD4254009.1 PAS domain S-box protein [Methanofollis sp.]
MDENEDKYHRVLDLLQRQYPRGMSISAIARDVDMNRGSVSKYLEVLLSRGDVRMEPFGKSKVYTASQRVPFSDLFDYLSNAIVILDADLHILMVNKNFITTFGILRERHVMGRGLYDMGLQLFDDQSIRRNIERVRQSETFITEMQYIEDGTNRIFLIEFFPTVSYAGKPGIMISLKDITRWKKTEEALKNTEKKIRTIFETVPSGIIFFEADGTILNANQASLDLLGIKSFQDLMNANLFDISCYKEKIQGLILQAKVAEIELTCDFDRLRRGDLIPTTRSGVAYFFVVFAPIAMEGGGVPHEFAILFRDITAEKLARKELIFKETRYRSFFDNTCNGVLIYEPIDDGNEYLFKDINRATETILQMKKEDLIGKKLFEEFPDLPDPDVRDALIRVLTTEKPEFLAPLQYRKGKNFPWMSHYIFKLPSGEIASFMVDVSEAVREDAASRTRDYCSHR